MNWQAVEDALADWVSLMTGTARSLIAWDREPVGYRTYQQIDLRFGLHRARENGETRLELPDDGGAYIRPTVSGERMLTWTIQVTTRDQHAAVRAYQVLDALALMFELPYSEKVFAGVGLTVVGPVGVIESTYPDSEHRDLCVAVLRVDLAYVLTVTAPPGAYPEAAMYTIEHAEVGGTAIDVTEPIVIPPRMMPPLPVPEQEPAP